MNDKGYSKALDCFERIWKEGLAIGKWQDDENPKKIMYDWFLSGWLLRVQADGIEGEVIGIGPLINGKVFDIEKTTKRLSATYSANNAPYCELGDKVKIVILPSEDK